MITPCQALKRVLKQLPEAYAIIRQSLSTHLLTLKKSEKALDPTDMAARKIIESGLEDLLSRLRKFNRDENLENATAVKSLLNFSVVGEGLNSLNRDDRAKKVKCYKCLQFGHWATKCTNAKHPESTYVPRGGASLHKGNQKKGEKKARDDSRIVCHGCKKKGHRQVNCPSKKKNDDEDGHNYLSVDDGDDDDMRFYGRNDEDVFSFFSLGLGKDIDDLFGDELDEFVSVSAKMVVAEEEVDRFDFFDWGEDGVFDADLGLVKIPVNPTVQKIEESVLADDESHPLGGDNTRESHLLGGDILSTSGELANDFGADGISTDDVLHVTNEVFLDSVRDLFDDDDFEDSESWGWIATDATSDQFLDYLFENALDHEQLRSLLSERRRPKPSSLEEEAWDELGGSVGMYPIGDTMLEPSDTRNIDSFLAVVDSGATTCNEPDHRRFKHMSKLGAPTVSAAGGQVSASGIGQVIWPLRDQAGKMLTLSIDGTVNLPNAIRLFSVWQCVKQGHSVTFTPKRSWLTLVGGRQVDFTVKGKYWVVKLQEPPEAKTEEFCLWKRVHRATISTALAHRRLGHASEWKMATAKKLGLIVGMDWAGPFPRDCAVCRQFDFPAASEGGAREKSDEPGALMAFDFWIPPARLHALFSCKAVLGIRDDCLGMVWVYPPLLRRLTCLWRCSVGMKRTLHL